MLSLKSLISQVFYFFTSFVSIVYKEGKDSRREALRKLLIALFLFPTLGFSSASNPVQAITSQVVRETPSVAAGSSFWLAAYLRLPEGIQTGWKLPLGDWQATVLNVRLPREFVLGQLVWPTPLVDISVNPPKVYYENHLCLLIEIHWRPGFSSRSQELQAAQGQLFWRGEAHFHGKSHTFSLSQIAIFPPIRFPNEVPLAADPLTLSVFKRARAASPKALDPANVEWMAQGKGFQVAGYYLDTTFKWVAVPFSVSAKRSFSTYVTAALLEHKRIGDIDHFFLPSEVFKQWQQAGVEEILLIDEKGRNGFIVTIEDPALRTSSRF